MANIAFEVGKGLLTKSQKDRYEKNFTKNVIKKLEHNLIQVCDPQIDQVETLFQKCHYKISSNLLHLSDTPGRWDMVLGKITLDNIHLYSP
jgi:hypothetical protein